jgi:predicted acyltransferase
MQRCGAFQRRVATMDTSKHVLAFFVGVGPALSNLSLQSNSIGVYQISKIVVLPCAALVGFLLHGKRVSLLQSTLLVGIVVAAVFTTSQDVDLNGRGIAIAAL